MDCQSAYARAQASEAVGECTSRTRRDTGVDPMAGLSAGPCSGASGVDDVRYGLVGFGASLPDRVVTNTDLSRTLDTSDDWIRERTGIIQRHLAKDDEYTSTFAIQSASRALEDAGLLAEDLDVIVVATSTPDYTFPATASLVHRALGAKKAFAFDMNVACSGFVFALATVESLLARLGGRHGLVIGAETMSRIVDWQDRSTAILFGDGAGAVVVSRQEGPQALTSKGQPRGLLASVLGSDGQHFDLLHVTSGPSRGKTSGVICMQGREVFRRATLALRQATLSVLEQGGCQLSDVDWIVPHQANKRILDSVAQGLGVPLERVIFTGDQHANTSAASIPLALAWGKHTGHLQPGQLVVMQAFGAGFSWGANLVRL